MTPVRPVLRGALALRARVLRRRFGSPLEAVAVVAATAIAWRVGAHVGAGAAVWLDPVLAAIVALAAGGAHRLLYASRELVLLLPAGLSPRLLVVVRLAELSALLLAALLPVLGLAAGIAGTTSPALVAAALLLGPAVAGAALLVGAALGRVGSGGRAVAGVLALGAIAAIAAAATPSPIARALLDLARGDLPALARLALLAGALATAAVALAPLGHEAGLTRAALRDARRRPPLWRALSRVAAPLGRDASALLARDLTLLLRGALPRGLVVLGLLPLLAALIVRGARADEALAPWLLELVALLVVGVSAAATGFLFGIDLPRARRAQLVLERTSPLRGRRVARARSAGAALGALPVVVAAALLVALDQDPERAAMALVVVAEGLALVLCVVHDAVGYGLRAECAGDPAVAGGYPVRAAPLVVAMAVGLAVHPALVLLYPLLGWYGEARRAAERWELEEVAPERAQAA